MSRPSRSKSSDTPVKDPYRRRVYASPPIEEAICEFRFESDDWDPTVPGRFYELVKDRYSAKPEEIRPTEAMVAAREGNPTNISLRELPARTRFATPDGLDLITIGPGLLNIIRKKPYSDWSTFREDVSTSAERFHGIVRPQHTQRIGVRYINRVEIPYPDEGAVKLETYFLCSPQDLSELSSDGMPHVLTKVLSRQEYLYPDGSELARVFATVRGKEGVVTILLDLDASWHSGDVDIQDLENTLELVDQLRTKERIAFEASITDECRNLFC